MADQTDKTFSGAAAGRKRQADDANELTVPAGAAGGDSGPAAGRQPTDTAANRPAGVSPGEATGVLPVEIGGQKGPEPTRYGDWEKNGRCTDF